MRSEFWLRTLLRWYVGLVIRPGATVREIVLREPPLRYGLLTAIVGTLVSFEAVAASVWLLDGREGFHLAMVGEDNGWLVAVVELTGYCGLVVTYAAIWGVSLHWTGKMFGRSEYWETTFSSMMFILLAGFTLLSAGMLVVGIAYPIIDPDRTGTENVAGFATLAIGPMSLLWVAVLATLLLRSTHGIRTLKAATAVAASVISTFVIGIFFAYIPWVLVILGLTALMGVSHFE